MKTTTLFTAVILALGISATAPLKAQVVMGPIINPAIGHSYYLVDGPSWTDIEAQAVALGGHLATVNTAEENAWIAFTFRGFGDLWIGLNDAAVEGQFVWSSGEPPNYVNWDLGQPDNWMDQEDYVHIWNGGVWNDNKNTPDWQMGGVVEVNEIRGAVNPANGSTYYFVGPNTWTGAEAAAVALGGHLATIDDAAENEWVTTQASRLYYLWIGFNDFAVEGNWVWSSGEPVTFTNWREGEPNNFGTEPENGALIYNFEEGRPWIDMHDWNIFNDFWPIFGVVEVTLAEQIDVITDIVDALDTSFGANTSLTSKLEEVQEALAAGDKVAACDSLRAFINATKAQSGKKKLTEDEAAMLIQEAMKTQAALGCE